MKIDTQIDIEITCIEHGLVAQESVELKSFVKDESKIEDLVINQIQRFLKSKDINEPILVIESMLTLNSYNYSSLELLLNKGDYIYELFIRVKHKREKISFPDYYTNPSFIFNDCDELASKLIKQSTILTNEHISPDYVFFDNDLLNPHRVGNFENGDEPISGSRDYCDEKKMINETLQKAPNLRINSREHFWVKGLKKPFDLSGIVPLYLYVSKNLKTIKRDVDMEMNIGRATIVYSVAKDNTIHLISGWAGNRNKKAA